MKKLYLSFPPVLSTPRRERERRDISRSRKKERERERGSGVNFSQASSVFNSCHCFEAGVVVSRNFSISIPPVSPLERRQPSFPTILYAS